MERKRNPERAVTKGLSGRLSQGMNGREDKGTVKEEGAVLAQSADLGYS